MLQTTNPENDFEKWKLQAYEEVLEYLKNNFKITPN